MINKFNFYILLILPIALFFSVLIINSQAAYNPAAPQIVVDNFGDHIATSNINLNNNWLSSNGDNVGVFIGTTGNIGFGTNQVNSAKVTLNKPSIGFGGVGIGGVDETLGIKFGDKALHAIDQDILNTNARIYAEMLLVDGEVVFNASGQLIVKAGTPLSPSIMGPIVSPIIDRQRSYMNFSSDNKISFNMILTGETYDGKDILTISNDGNVGIKNNNPIYKLDLSSEDVMAEGICLGTDCISSWDAIAYSFECGDLIYDEDGNSYKTVAIGNQCWMAESLRTGVMITGNEQPTNNNIIEKWCPLNSGARCNLGGLYSWDEAMGYTSSPGAQGICPTGWHIPTSTEYNELEQFVLAKIQSPNPQNSCTASGMNNRFNRCADNDGSIFGGVNGVGRSLRILGDGTGVRVGNDLVGFKGIPTGLRMESGGWMNPEIALYLWVSQEHSPTHAYFRGLHNAASGISFYYESKERGASIRCIKDN